MPRTKDCHYYWEGCGRRYSLFQGFIMILSLATFFARNPNGYLSEEPTRFNIIGLIMALFFPVPYLVYTLLVPTPGGANATGLLYLIVCVWALVLWGVRNSHGITAPGIMGLFVAIFFPYIYILYAYADPQKRLKVVKK